MTTETISKTAEQAADQARAQLSTICIWHQAYQFCDREGQDFEEQPSDVQSFLNDEMDWEHDPDHMNTRDAISEMVLEDALEVKVKSDWHCLGEDPELGEYMILLCTGGPAVRIVGDLEGDQPMTAKLQSQGWFTDWTDCPILDTSTEALLWYAEQFYWEQA